MKNAKSNQKLREDGGRFLRKRRTQLDLTMAQISFNTGVISLSQMAIYKLETGVKGIRLSDIRPLSIAYKVEAKELLKFTEYSEGEFTEYLKSAPSESGGLSVISPNKLVTITDLKFKVIIAEGLETPLTLSQVMQLLSQRPQP